MPLTARQLIEKNGETLSDQITVISLGLFPILDSFNLDAPDITKWCIQDIRFCPSSRPDKPFEQVADPVVTMKRGETLNVIAGGINKYFSGARSVTLGILPGLHSSSLEPSHVISVMSMNKADVSLPLAYKIAAFLMDTFNSGYGILELEDILCLELFCRGYSIGFISIPLADIFISVKVDNSHYLELKKRGVENLYNTLVTLSNPIPCFQKFRENIKGMRA